MTTIDEIKCPCCNNPWARAPEGFFAGGNMCMTCTEGSNEDMDVTVDPSHNFFQYANGGWMKNNPIPPGYPSWNTFTSLHVKSQENLKDILEELLKKEELDENETKLKLFFQAAMDEAALEEQRLVPLEPLLNQCCAISTKEGTDLCQSLGEMYYKHGICPFVRVSASPDSKHSAHSILQVSQGGLGLPDRDYYFDEDKQEIRNQYKLHIANMLKLTSEEVDTTAIAEEIYKVEEQLAEAHMTKTECRDPQATYNKMSNVKELQEKLGGETSFDFCAFLLGATGETLSEDEVGEVNVRNVAALQRVAQVVSRLDPKTLQYYLHWHIVHVAAQYMFDDLVMEDFRFSQQVLAGTKEIKPRWKRAMQFVEDALGEALGQLYCARYFDESSKERALRIVGNVRKALEDRLKEVEWMTADSTRTSALTKMNAFGVKIGYPDKWLDYSDLKFDAEKDASLLSMALAARAFEVRRMVKEDVNQATNREKWFMTPQTVNAYYHPNLNEIVFPAAILQKPFFTNDDVTNYGAMGAVVGHEMTHGFDDKGRKFDASGNMVDWWTEKDGAEYDRRVKVMVQQANDYQVYGQSVRGELTCGENIADLGGLRLALRALLNQEELIKDTSSSFTPVQRFFLGWAQCWRQNITKQRSLQLLTIDPHGPNEMRCNGPLSNMPEFHDAFNVGEESPMYKPADQRVDIW